MPSTSASLVPQFVSFFVLFVVCLSASLSQSGLSYISFYRVSAHSILMCVVDTFDARRDTAVGLSVQ